MSNPIINVAVIGALGKMGQEVIKTIIADPELTLTAAVDRKQTGEPVGKVVGADDPNNVLLTATIEDAIKETNVDVAVDFTHPSCVFNNAKTLINAGIRPVIGATGLSSAELDELDKLLKAKNLGGVMAPNFALGAVMLMKFAEEAAQYFDHAEIIELHHNQKADAPSGTAIKTAEKMKAGLNKANKQQFGSTNCNDTETIKGSRGGVTEENLHIHSVRLPGLIAHQEVLLGSQGELLTIRHDTTNRTCFMPGVAIAVKKVMALTGLTYGLEHLL